ncbi:CLUMA_CG016800, isoform A [Clunio marinus]|uniref:CLUMA_CG016800, isoform A n=1 Tax=Clunio marinus TaxID=568069 RepID=A0A1J1IU42_9DIPT|nr:CLUMA_CG016800, isoform A [Clunio marinus]
MNKLSHIIPYLMVEQCGGSKVVHLKVVDVCKFRYQQHCDFNKVPMKLLNYLIAMHFVSCHCTLGMVYDVFGKVVP